MIAVMIEIVFIYDSVANQGMSSVNKLNRMGFFMFEKCRFMIEKLLDVQCGRKGGWKESLLQKKKCCTAKNDWLIDWKVVLSPPLCLDM